METLAHLRMGFFHRKIAVIGEFSIPKRYSAPIWCRGSWYGCWLTARRRADSQLPDKQYSAGR
ncbi:hypothetical protein DSL62_12890 [Pantoea sp. 3_1284]|nr:hypothetical protein DSL62_12890 [Pantoea sp. 3_1284]